MSCLQHYTLKLLNHKVIWVFLIVIGSEIHVLFRNCQISHVRFVTSPPLTSDQPVMWLNWTIFKQKICLHLSSINGFKATPPLLHDPVYSWRFFLAKQKSRTVATFVTQEHHKKFQTCRKSTQLVWSTLLMKSMRHYTNFVYTAFFYHTH